MEDRDDISAYAFSLENLERSIFGLIEHLANYNGAFTDYIESLGKGFADPKTAKETMTKLFSSNFIHEYRSLSSNAMPYRANINKVEKDIRKIRQDPDKFHSIIDARIVRLKSQGETNINRSDVETDTDVKMRGIRDMCRHDYGYYIQEIQTRVTEVIGRIELVVNSFPMQGRSTIASMLLQMIRRSYAELPDNLMDAYEMHVAGGWSLKTKTALGMAAEEYEESEYRTTGEELDLQGDNILALKYRFYDYLEQMFPMNQKINIQQLPCSTPEEFYFIISALCLAGEQSAYEKKEYIIVEEESTNRSEYNDRGYLIPHVIIMRIDPKTHNAQEGADT